jgi:hypothetical protein
MAEQATVLGTAAQQLKPLQNNNIGAIVQENIRYWNQVETQEEAARKASAARAAEFEYKKKNDRDNRIDKIASALETKESSGYFDLQVVDYTKKRIEEFGELELKARNGEIDPSTLLTKRREIQQDVLAASNLNNASQAKSTELKDTAFNPALDYRKIMFMQMMANQQIVFDPEARQAKGTMLNGEDVNLSMDELNSYIRGIQPSAITNFNEQAGLLTDNIEQKDNNGNIIKSANDLKTTRAKAEDFLVGNRLIEFAYEQNLRNSQEDPSVLEEAFTVTEKENLIEAFNQDYLIPALKEKNNSINNANTESQISNREEEETTPNQTIAQATNNGQPLVLTPEVYSRISKITSSGKLVETQNVNGELEVYNALDEKGDPIIIGDKTGTRYRYEVQGFVRNKETKQIGLIGYKLETVPVGEPVGVGKEQFFEEIRTQAINFNPTDVNQAASSQRGVVMIDGKEVSIKGRNENDVRSMIDRLTGTTTTQKTDAFGNIIE